jgi:type II secretory pathway pseudopilin PulG
MIKFRKKQIGIGLLELMLSLAIIAILLVMATRYYLSASLSSNINEVISNIQGVTGCYENWRQAYMSGSNPKSYTDFNLQDCVANGWFPASNASGENLITPWGTANLTETSTDITVNVTTANETQAKNLYVKLGGNVNNWSGGKNIQFSIVQQILISPAP